MKNLFVIGDRLAWPPVGCCAIVAAAVVIFDLAWRTVRIPFESLVIYALLAGLGAVVLAVAVIFAINAKRKL